MPSRATTESTDEAARSDALGLIERGMRVYQVGGSVRDELLGLPVRDRDWVVVGATPDELIALGYRPVGKDFPVFLHPHTHEEYALARTERKTAPGYHGFTFHAAPDVTLEEDLQRRDLTINAIAKDEHGALVDPFGGQGDLRARLFRHVGAAFEEDPVRILRVARFAARFPDFSIAPETRVTLGRMVAAGEVDALVPERVWQELSRGLMEVRPSRMVETLRACGALARLLPELDALWMPGSLQTSQTEGGHGAQVASAVDAAARLGFALPVRFAVLTHALGEGEADLPRKVSERLRVPADCRDLASMVARDRAGIGRFAQMQALSVVELLERCDALRKPERFAQMLDACEAIAHAPAGAAARPFAVRAAWMAALAAARSIDAGAIAAPLASRPEAIREAVHRARIAAVAQGLGGA